MQISGPVYQLEEGKLGPAHFRKCRTASAVCPWAGLSITSLETGSSFSAAPLGQVIGGLGRKMSEHPDTLHGGLTALGLLFTFLLGNLFAAFKLWHVGGLDAS